MANETVTVINELCSKIGIAVDWTQENIVPQITELIQRYRTYSICSEVFYTAIALILAIPSACVALSIIKNTINENKTSIWYKMEQSYTFDVFVWLALIFAGTFCLTGIVFFVIEIDSIIKWIFIPEVRFYEVILSAMK